MSKQDPLKALKQDPQGAALLGDKQALAALLQSDEAKTLAQLVKKLQSDPRGAKAMASMDKKLGH